MSAKYKQIKHEVLWFNLKFGCMNVKMLFLMEMMDMCIYFLEYS